MISPSIQYLPCSFFLASSEKVKEIPPMEHLDVQIGLWARMPCPKTAFADVFEQLLKVADCLAPGSCFFIPKGVRLWVGSFIMAFGGRPMVDVPWSCVDANCRISAIGEIMFSMGASTWWHHVPAAVRGFCLAAIRCSYRQIFGQLPSNGPVIHTHGVQRLSAVEMDAVASLESNLTDVTPKQWAIGDFAELRNAMLLTLSNVPAQTMRQLPFVVSDALEEQAVLQAEGVTASLDGIESREFLSVIKGCLAIADSFVPHRLLCRLARVELASFEDFLPGVDVLNGYLSQWQYWDGVGVPLEFFAVKGRLNQRVREFLSDLLRVMPSVAARSFVAFRELVGHFPTHVSYAALVCGCGPSETSELLQFPLNVFSVAPASHLLRWVAFESPYAVEVASSSAPTEVVHDNLLHWPLLLLDMLGSTSLKLEVTRRGSIPFGSVNDELKFRRRAIEVLKSEVEEDTRAIDALGEMDDGSDRLHVESFIRAHPDLLERIDQPHGSRHPSPPMGQDEGCKELACDALVNALLGHDSCIGELSARVEECHRTLGDVETVLTTFLQKILAVKREIGDLRLQSKKRSAMLENSVAVEKVISEVIAHLVVPLDVVHLIASADTTVELGPQFRHSLKILLGILHDRCGQSGHHKVVERVPAPSIVQPSTRSVRIVLAETSAFKELLGVAEDLAVLACVRIKAAVEDKMVSLRKPRTNIAVQQEHILGPMQGLIKFMKLVMPLLRRVSSGIHAASLSERHVHTVPPIPQFHYDVVRRLYIEMRQNYVGTMRVTYFNNISRYLLQLNKFEDTSPRGWGIFGATTSAIFTLPALTDSTNRISPTDFGLGRRLNLFSALLGHPAVPLIVGAKGQRLTYEETFRSVNVMLCDVVTREFLFTFEFFCGDNSVYVDVFQPTIQRLVDYVSEVLLQFAPVVHTEALRGKASTHSRIGNMVYSCSNTDVVGILSLIRMCHVFRSHMHSVRRLECLNGYYDSLLTILWPAFKRAFDLQLDAMKSLTPTAVTSFLSTYRTPMEKLCAVHPITMRFAELSAAVLALSIPLTRENPVEGAIPSPPLARDDVDSEDHFVALRANLSMLRIEFIRAMTSVSAQLVVDGSSIAHTFSAAPLLNNTFHVQTIWALTPSLRVSSGENDSSASGIEQFVSARSVAECSDYTALCDVLNTARSQLIEQVLQHIFPGLLAIARGNPDLREEVLVQAAAFTSNWQRLLADARQLLCSIISHPQNQKETFPQLCMQLLLYNTRAHGTIATVADQNSLRSVIVTNHQLVQYMRTSAGVSLNVE